MARVGRPSWRALCRGRRVFAVESSAPWLDKMQAWFAANPAKAELHLHHGDIGKTRDWGFPVDHKALARWSGYPVSVWDRPDFQHPDVVLIDGRFRLACALTVLFRITRPVTGADRRLHRPARLQTDRNAGRGARDDGPHGAVYLHPHGYAAAHALHGSWRPLPTLIRVREGYHDADDQEPACPAGRRRQDKS